LPAEVILLSRRPAHAGRHEARERESVLLLTIREGRNRQVRRMCEAVGHPVRRLKRTKFGPIADRRLEPGDWRELTAAEVEALHAQQHREAGTAPRVRRAER
jgi:pseudouridine synthase